MFLTAPRDRELTYAEPEADASFTQRLWDASRLRDWQMSDPLLALGQAMAGATLDVARRPDAYSALVAAAERETRLVGTAASRIEALAEAADLRIRIVQEQTGAQLQNPFRQGYYFEARRRVEEARARGQLVEAFGPAVLAEARNIFNEELDKVAEGNPDKAAALQFYQPLEEQAEAIASRAAADLTAAGAGKLDSVASLAARFAGGLWGSRRDPLFVSSLFFGPSGAAGTTALARVGSSAIRQGAFNAGLQVAEEPFVQAWRQQVGLETGVVPALENIGLAALFGAVPGAAIQGVRELAPAAREAAARVLSGNPRPGDVETAARAVGVELTDDQRAVVRAADRVDEAARAADPSAPAGVPRELHDDIAGQAIRHAEDPANNPPPEIALVAPERPADQVRVIDEDLPAAIGARETVDGKPVRFERFAPAEIEADAATFQYKGGGDESGVTDRLRNVSRWDPTASGKTFVFERADGRRFIADGHQRLGLARRLSAEGDSSIRLDGYLFREADGWTPADVRALAAKKNMQEGSGDAIDAARILRERPDLLDGSLPVTSPMMRQATALARLSDEAFGMVNNGLVPPGHAAAVGAMVPDRLQHAAVMAELAKFRPETEREARLLIGEVLAAGFRAEQQIDLFGASTATRTLLIERVKVLNRAMTQLAQDKRIFGTLAERADVIEAAGNQLDRTRNEARAMGAATLQDLLARLAQRTGPISDALNRAAAATADGAKPAQAARTFLEEARQLIERDGLAGLIEPQELRPRATAEPGTPEAVATAEAAASEHAPARAAEGGERPAPSADEPSLFDAVPVERADGSATLVSRDEALAQADRTQHAADVVASCKDK